MVTHKGAFEHWAASQSYDLAPAEPDFESERYADSQTQAAFLAWKAGASFIAIAVTGSTGEAETFVERILAFTERNGYGDL